MTRGKCNKSFKKGYYNFINSTKNKYLPGNVIMIIVEPLLGLD